MTRMEPITRFGGEDRAAPSRYSSSFPLYWDIAFDRTTAPDYGLQIGYSSEYPEDLLRRVTAARISVQLGVTVQTALKYVPEDSSYHEDEKLDAVIRKTCLRLLRDSLFDLRELNENRNVATAIGKVAGGIALFRVDETLKSAFYLADVGTLYECAAVGRVCLENLAWCSAVLDLDDPDKVRQVSAQGSIGILARIVPYCGRLYGWLSEHSHWAYSAHIKAFGERDGLSASIVRSESFKVQSYASLIVLCALCDSFIRREISRMSECDSTGVADIFFELYERLESVVAQFPEDRLTVAEVARLRRIFWESRSGSKE